jgi:UDP-glucose 4-epimerase
MIIVIGSNGFIGKSILNYLNFYSNPDKHIGINRDDFELLDRIDFNKHNFSTVIFCVGNQLQYNKSDELSHYVENEIKLIAQIMSKIKSQKLNFIYFSSAGTLYGQTGNLPSFEYSTIEPHNNYGLYKLKMENYLSGAFVDRDVSVFTLRVSNVYGPIQKPNLGQGVISTLVSNMLNSKQSNIRFEGNEMRDYLYIDDLCSAVFSIASRSHPNQNYLYNISRGESVSTNFIIDQIYEALRSRSINRERNLISYVNSIEHEQQTDSFIDSSKFQSELNWNPRVNLNIGISKVLEYQVNK